MGYLVLSNSVPYFHINLLHICCLCSLHIYLKYCIKLTCLRSEQALQPVRLLADSTTLVRHRPNSSNMSRSLTVSVSFTDADSSSVATRQAHAASMTSVVTSEYAGLRHAAQPQQRPSQYHTHTHTRLMALCLGLPG